jgi:hypothetical protein
VKLKFEIGQQGKFWAVKVFYYMPPSLPRVTDPLPLQEYLEEHQYQKIADWCTDTFNTKKDTQRVRRMSYDSFWFKNQRDLDWFVLYWSSVDNSTI